MCIYYLMTLFSLAAMDAEITPLEDHEIELVPMGDSYEDSLKENEEEESELRLVTEQFALSQIGQSQEEFDRVFDLIEQACLANDQTVIDSVIQQLAVAKQSGEFKHLAELIGQMVTKIERRYGRKNPALIVAHILDHFNIAPCAQQNVSNLSPMGGTKFIANVFLVGLAIATFMVVFLASSPIHYWERTMAHCDLEQTRICVNDPVAFDCNPGSNQTMLEETRQMYRCCEQFAKSFCTNLVENQEHADPVDPYKPTIITGSTIAGLFFVCWLAKYIIKKRVRSLSEKIYDRLDTVAYLLANNLDREELETYYDDELPVPVQETTEHDPQQTL